MPKNHQGGSLDERIGIERAVITYSTLHEPIETYIVINEVWANHRDVSASEAYRSSEISAELSARFVVRFSASAAMITPKDRVLYRNKSYNIVAIRESIQSRKSFIEIDAVVRDDQD
ncbi:MAG: phage head closure protein [Candidatus Paceibacterota bacterium]